MVEAALTLADRGGLDAVTMQSVASALGVTPMAIYRHVAEILRLPPSALLSVGDDPQNDVSGPKKAGWQAVQIERPKRDLWSAVRAVTKR